MRMQEMTTRFMQQVLQNAASMGGLFQDLDATALDTLIGLAEMAPFDDDAVVFEEGAIGDLMYVVVSGKMEVYRKDTLGGEVRLAVLGEGDVFGEMAILEHVRRTASVRALGPSITLALSRNDLIEQPALALQLYRNVARMLSRRLRLTTDVLLSFETQARMNSGDSVAVPE